MFDSLIEQHPHLENGFRLIASWLAANPEANSFYGREIVLSDPTNAPIWETAIAISCMVGDGLLSRQYGVTDSNTGEPLPFFYDRVEDIPASVIHEGKEYLLRTMNLTARHTLTTKGKAATGRLAVEIPQRDGTRLLRSIFENAKAMRERDTARP